MPRALMNWSGGKDAALCLHKVLQEGKYSVSSLLTTVNAHHQRISQHGVRVTLLKQQVGEIGLPLHLVHMPRYPSMETYGRLMEEALRTFKDRQVQRAIFGDILLEDVRAYRERQLDTVGFTGLFPLWQQPTEQLIREFMTAGFKAVVVCVNEDHLDKSFAGRDLDEAFLADLPDDVDPCGENGEFHTFVYDGPIFEHPLNFEKGDVVYREYTPPNDDPDDSCKMDDHQPVQQTGFWYCDLLPTQNALSPEMTLSEKTDRN